MNDYNRPQIATPSISSPRVPGSEVMWMPAMMFALSSLALSNASPIDNQNSSDACEKSPEAGDRDEANPKMSDRLNGLVEAARQGRAQSYARKESIDLVDGNVRVVVDSTADLLDAATRAASVLGTVELTSKSVDTGGVQALMPITNLIRLSREPGVHYIRVPVRPVKELTTYWNRKVLAQF